MADRAAVGMMICQVTKIVFGQLSSREWLGTRRNGSIPLPPRRVYTTVVNTPSAKGPEGSDERALGASREGRFDKGVNPRQDLRGDLPAASLGAIGYTPQ